MNYNEAELRVRQLERQLAEMEGKLYSYEEACRRKDKVIRDLAVESSSIVRHAQVMSEVGKR